jgi:hypothetical protein
MLLLRVIWAVVRALFSKKADLVAENLALRQQLIVTPPRRASDHSLSGVELGHLGTV